MKMWHIHNESYSAVERTENCHLQQNRWIYEALHYNETVKVIAAEK